MSKRFQFVRSLLRPESLLQYKTKMEQREDITYEGSTKLDKWMFIKE